MTDLVAGVRLTADGKDLIGASRAAQDALKGLSDTAKKANEDAKVAGDTVKKGNNEAAAAAKRFTDSLKRQADTIGLTASQALKYDAAQLKLNSTQRASVDASIRTIDAYERTQAAASKNVDVLGSLKTQLIASAAAYLSLRAAIDGGKAIVDAALAQERLNNTLKVGLGSQQAATKEIKFLREESERLGLEFVSTSAQYAKLTAASKGTELQGQATRDIFLAVAKASTVLNLSADQTGGALTAIEQIISKGKVSAEELRGQLGERLPGAFQIAARAINVTTAELDQMLVRGELTAQQLLPALAQELEKTYGAQALEAAQGLNAQINRMDNSFTDLKLAVGETGIINLFSDGVVAATGFIGITAQVIEQLKAINTEVSKTPILGSIGAAATGNSTTTKALFGGGVLGLIFGEEAQADIQKTTKDLEQAEAVMNRITRPGAKPEPPKEFAAAIKKEAAERAKLAKAREAEVRRAIDGSKRIIEAFKRETEEVGKSAVQKRLLSAATEAAKAPTQELAEEIMASAQAWAQATQQQEALLAAEKDRIETVRAIEQAEQQAARKTRQEWTRVGRSIEQTARTSFVQFAANGRSAMESIGESIKLSIIDVLYQLTVRKWIINIGTSLIGGGGIGGALSGFGGGAGGGTLGAVFNSANLLNAGQTIFSGFSNGLSNAAGSILGGLGRTFGLSSFSAGASGAASAGVFGPGGLGYLSGATNGTTAAIATGSEFGAAATLGSSLSAAAGPAVIALAATQILKSLAGDKRVGGSFGKALNFVGDIPIVGDLLPVVPLINGLFGRGPLKQKRTTLSGTIGSEGFLEGFLETLFKAKGGLFRSNKNDFTRVDAVTGEITTDNNKLLDFANSLARAAKEIVGQINDVTTQVSGNLKQIGAELNLSTAQIDSYRREIKLVSEKGKLLTEEQISQEIAAISDELARSLLPNLDELAKRGETALQTVNRVGLEFTTLVNAASTILGKSAAEAREQILNVEIQDRTAFFDKAGGVDSVAQFTQFFAANFLTAAERLAPAQKRLNDELTRLELPLDLTGKQFRDLVQSFEQADGTSEDLWISLKNLAQTFVEVRSGVQQLDQAYAAQARQIVDNREQLAKNNNQLLLNNADSAFGTLQRAVNAERDSLTTAYNKSLEDVNARIDEVTDSVGKLRTLSNALNQTVVALRPISRDVAKQQIQDAINTAKSGGGLPDADDLREALTTLARRDSKGFASSFEFEREQRKTANLVGDLSSLANEQLSVEERSLVHLEEQRQTLTQGFEQETLRLDSLLDNAQLRLAELKGINTSILSVAEALAGFNTSAVNAGGVVSSSGSAAGSVTITPAAAQAANVGPSPISDQQIRDFFDVPRGPGEIALAAAQNNIPSTRIARVLNLSESQRLQFFRDNPNIRRFASGGSHTGGLRIVGEVGPELEATGPSHITSNSDLRKMMSDDNVVAELRLLKVELTEVKKFNKRLSKKLDDVTTTNSKGQVLIRTGT